MTDLKAANRRTLEERIDDMMWLHPRVRDRFLKLEQRLKEAHQRGETGTLFLPFETYRTPHRQAMLAARPDKPTRAGPWKSAHQFGLACDFVPWSSGNTGGRANGWSWEDVHDWDFLKHEAGLHGLERPWDWDKAHIQVPDAWIVIDKYKFL